MLKAYKYCIKPTTMQQQLLQNNFDAARYVYNCSLALKSYVYKRSGITLGLKELKGRLPKLRQRHSWLKEAYSAVLQQSVINLDIAFKKFFKGQVKYPRFKSKRARQSVQYPANITVNIENNTIHIPKIGAINLIMHRDLGLGSLSVIAKELKVFFETVKSTIGNVKLKTGYTAKVDLLDSFLRSQKCQPSLYYDKNK